MDWEVTEGYPRCYTEGQNQAGFTKGGSRTCSETPVLLVPMFWLPWLGFEVDIESCVDSDSSDSKGLTLGHMGCLDLQCTK